MKGVKILIDQERTLRFDAIALADLERASRMSLLEMFRLWANRDMPYHLVLAMLYAGLQHELPGLSERQIADLIDAHVAGGSVFEKILSFAEPCAAALAEALPKAKNVAPPGKEPGEAEAGTGMSSKGSDTVSASSPATSGDSLPAN